MDSTNRLGELIAKCWDDAAFKKRFITDPKGVLAEFDVDVPASLEIVVVENTDNKMFVTLPAKPRASTELNDDELVAVTGGLKMQADTSNKANLTNSTNNLVNLTNMTNSTNLTNAPVVIKK